MSNPKEWISHDATKTVVSHVNSVIRPVMKLHKFNDFDGDIAVAKKKKRIEKILT